MSQLPPEDELTAEWWAGTRNRRLLLQTCLDCLHRQHHPRNLCLSCQGTNLGYTEATGDGVVDTFTLVHRSPRPDLEVPYVIARVRLAEGPVMLSTLLGDDEWQIGDAVRVDFQPLSDGRALPVFRRMQ